MKNLNQVSVSFIIKQNNKLGFFADSINESIFKNEHFKEMCNEGKIEVFMPDIYDATTENGDLYIVGFLLGFEMTEEFKKNEDLLIEGFKQKVKDIESKYSWSLEKVIVDKLFTINERVEY